MKSNLTNEQVLSDLTKAYGKRTEILETDAMVFAGEKVSEEEVIRDVLKSAKTQLTLGERIVELPGLAANLDLIVGAVSKFKDDVYEGNIKHSSMAMHDDISVALARPQDFGAMQAGDVDSFQVTGQSAGESASLIPQGNGTRAGGYSTLADEQWLFFTGDFIDLNSNAVVTAIQYADVDGETNLKPENTYLSERGTDVQVSTVSAQLIKSRIDIDGFCALAGDVEVVPVVINICKGEHLPTLTGA